jgi:hypothetical protein
MVYIYVILVGPPGVARDFYCQLSLCLSVSLSLCLYVSLCLCLSVSLSLCLSVSLSLCLSVSLSLCLSVSLSLCLSVSCSLALSLSLSPFSPSCARDFYYQLSLLLSLYVLLYLSLPISLSLSPPPLFPDKKFPALDPTWATSHLYIICAMFYMLCVIILKFISLKNN